MNINHKVEQKMQQADEQKQMCYGKKLMLIKMWLHLQIKKMILIYCTFSVVVTQWKQL